MLALQWARGLSRLKPHLFPEDSWDGIQPLPHKGKMWCYNEQVEMLCGKCVRLFIIVEQSWLFDVSYLAQCRLKFDFDEHIFEQKVLHMSIWHWEKE